MTAPLGRIYLPAGPGTGVGRFDFLVDPEHEHLVSVGTPVAADTAGGVFTGAVVDMRVVGTDRDPVAADLAGADGSHTLARVPEVMVATVQTLASPAMRPVRAGDVRAATASELTDATGATRMEWPIPAGVIPCADGTPARVCLDGHALLGPESSGITIGGLSGQAAKSSYAGVLLRCALHHARPDRDTVAALIVNVKGEDLLWLDQPADPGREPTPHDLGMYAALGVPAAPFDDVTVYAPSLPGGGTSRSPRQDAHRLRWDLTQVFGHIRHLLPGLRDDEKASSFLAEFRESLLLNPDPTARIDTFAKLAAWFDRVLSDAEGSDSAYAWRHHHKATLWRLRRMLLGLVPRCGGLLSTDTAGPADDVPDTGWRPGQVVVVDVAGLDTDVQALVIARTFERLLRSAEHGDLGVGHLVVMADELNRFAPAHGGEHAAVRRVLQRIAREGRYAGVSLWGIGQQLSDVDPHLVNNAASRALGVTPDGELAAGMYRLPAGLAERVATLPKGQMLLSHHTFRSPLLVHFPRPAWRTGRSVTSASRPRLRSVDALPLSTRSRQRLLEGVPEQVAERVVAAADDPHAAVQALQEIRVPDLHAARLHAPATADPADPYALD